MKVGDEIIVKIEKIADSGLARYNGLVIFVENSCPQDTLKVKITKINKKYAYADIIEIIEPSIHRVKPFCPLQKVCGACQIQYIDYDYQLIIKKQIVEDAIHKIAGLNVEIKDVIASPKKSEYRFKSQYPISQTKVSKRILAGYYKKKSHDVVNIKYCPIQPKISDEIIEYIRNLAITFDITGFDEKSHKGDLRHIILRMSKSTNKILVVLVVNSSKVFDRLKLFATDLYNHFEQIQGVCVNFNSQKTNVILGRESKCVIGCNFITDTLCNKVFKIGATSFFQINPYTAENIFQYVQNYIHKNFKNPVILDAYAGIATFGQIVSDNAKKVISVEENAEAVKLAKESSQLNEIHNLEIYNQDTQLFLDNETNKFDVIILDPPRKGCTLKTLDSVVKLSKGKIIYVSCNPATLARDLKYLTEKGAKVDFIQPFDMFCHTTHVECVAIISF